MKGLSRREAMLGLAAAGVAARMDGQATVEDGGGSFGKARVITPELKKTASGAERWMGPAGTLATGEVVSLHETAAAAGAPASNPHRVEHSEVIVVMEGKVEYWHDGVTDGAEAGSVLYVAYGTKHSLKNVGTGEARYLVIQVGGDTKKAV